jgi:hypothetical protein
MPHVVLGPADAAGQARNSAPRLLDEDDVGCGALHDLRGLREVHEGAAVLDVEDEDLLRDRRAEESGGGEGRD